MLKATDISFEVECQGFVNFSCLTVAITVAQSNRVECRTQIPACLLPGKHAAHTFSLHGAISCSSQLMIQLQDVLPGSLPYQSRTTGVPDVTFFSSPGGVGGSERPISANLGLKLCSVSVFCLPLRCLEQHFMLSLSYIGLKVQQYFVSSSDMILDEKTLIKIQLNPKTQPSFVEPGLGNGYEARLLCYMFLKTR